MGTKHPKQTGGKLFDPYLKENPFAHVDISLCGKRSTHKEPIDPPTLRVHFPCYPVHMMWPYG